MRNSGDVSGSVCLCVFYVFGICVMYEYSVSHPRAASSGRDGHGPVAADAPADVTTPLSSADRTRCSRCPRTRRLSLPLVPFAERLRAGDPLPVGAVLVHGQPLRARDGLADRARRRVRERAFVPLHGSGPFCRRRLLEDQGQEERHVQELHCRALANLLNLLML